MRTTNRKRKDQESRERIPVSKLEALVEEGLVGLEVFLGQVLDKLGGGAGPELQQKISKEETVQKRSKKKSEDTWPAGI